ncbi:MAG: hypothetical protein WEC00_02145 [Dongiaceae bacterium]
MHNDRNQELALARCDAAFAFRLLEFSIRIESFLSLGKLDFEAFGQEVTILLESKNISFSDGYFSSKENSVQASSMSIGVAFGATAIALDNYFEVARGRRDADSADPADALWAIVYAVRNAFAHGIANPRWKISPQYRREFLIEHNGERVTVDLRNLDGREFKYEQIGGVENWYKLKRWAFELLSMNYAGFLAR